MSNIQIVLCFSVVSNARKQNVVQAYKTQKTEAKWQTNPIHSMEESLQKLKDYFIVTKKSLPNVKNKFGCMILNKSNN